MGNLRLTAEFMKTVLEVKTGWELTEISGWEVVAALWPLNEVFRPRLSGIRSAPYCADFEAEVDAAIEAFAFDLRMWVPLSLQAWRVLLERHQQTTTLALMSEAEDSPFTLLPRGLPESAKLTVLMLQLLHSMCLPFPAENRSGLVLPHELPQVRGEHVRVRARR